MCVRASHGCEGHERAPAGKVSQRGQGSLGPTEDFHIEEQRALSLRVKAGSPDVTGEDRQNQS